MQDFKNIDYLKFGNSRQREVYALLKEIRIFETLKDYDPILTGTIPIAIDLPESDIDIICQCRDHEAFSIDLTRLFSTHSDFEIERGQLNGAETTIAKFNIDNYQFEIFGQYIPTKEQNAYRHMIIENKILSIRGPEFRSGIIELKKKGLKTEPAFASLLGLSGNPYEALLKYKW